MIRHKKTLITAAILIALFLLARPAGGAVISYSPTDFTIFAGGDLTIGVTSGTGSYIEGMVGAGGDVTIGDNVTIADSDGFTGSIFADDDVIIGDGVYITGRVLADDSDRDDLGVVIGDYVTVLGRVDAGATGGSAADIVVGNYSKVGDIYSKDGVTLLTYAEVLNNINADDVNLGANSHVYGDVTYKKTYTADPTAVVDGSLTKGTPIAPDSFTYTLPTAPTFDRTGTVDPDITSDSELAPGAYRDLIVRAGTTLTVYAGTYDFQNITLEAGANISIRGDTFPGDVIIQAFEDLFTAGNNVLGRVGQAQLVVNIGNLLTIGSGSTVAASLLAYSDTITSIVDIGDNTTLYGKVYSAGDVIIGDDVVVPEPDSMVLLSFGAVCLLMKRRRRGSRA